VRVTRNVPAAHYLKAQEVQGQCIDLINCKEFTDYWRGGKIDVGPTIKASYAMTFLPKPRFL
jgi:hypothetical protein